MRRRDFLAWLGLGAAGAASASACSPVDDSGSGAAPPARLPSSFVPDVELELTAAPRDVQIRPGAATRVWSYTGAVVKGPPELLQPVADSFLGPTIRVRQGQKVRVHLKNELPEPTIIHWHGLDVPAEMDGHPRFAVPSGQGFVYEFEVRNRAGTYWYHPHHHDRTGPQVYNGLAGLLLVSDAEEAALNLPSGAEEIVCVLQDRTLGADNQLIYLSGMPMEAVSGFFGGIVLVNGRMPPTFALASRAYRFRLLNGSHSRVYKLAWSDDAPITVIGSDGGLLEKPLQRPFLTLAPGERADLVRDLSESAVGARIELYSLPFPTSAFEMGMGMGMMRGRGRMGGRGVAPLPSDGAPASLLTIHVERREASRFELPASLSAFGPAWQPAAAGRVAARVFPVDFSGMQWLLNGRTFVMEEVAVNETVTAGAKEVWEFTNTGAGMMGMGLAHPLHVHGRQFRILNREIDRATAELWAPLREGLTDEGWKDTFLIMPGERVQILVEASHHPGLYLYHCHNLVHEDMGMMRNYRIVAAAG